MRNKKMLWNKDRTKNVETEKIKRLVIQRMTLFFENEDEDEFYTVKGCFTEDCNEEDEDFGFGDFDSLDEAKNFTKDLVKKMRFTVIDGGKSRKRRIGGQHG